MLQSRCSLSSVKPELQSHTSSLGSGVELSESTASSKARSETVDSIFSAVAKKRVVTCEKGTKNLFLELQAQPANPQPANRLSSAASKHGLCDMENH